MVTHFLVGTLALRNKGIAMPNIIKSDEMLKHAWTIE